MTPSRGPGLSTRLGWVSFFNDASGEALSRALPLVLTAGLGATPAFVGLVEGAAEAASIGLKAVSGWISDRMTSRKPLVAGGYLLSFLAKVLYLALHLPGGLGLARVLDRVGKGLRSAPRDAMVADAAAAGALGREFGLNRMLDTLGAVTGLLLVLVLGLGRGPLEAGAFRHLVLLALPSGLVAVLLVFLWLPRVPRIVTTKPLAWTLPREIRGYLALVLLFGLANSSDAFLVLRARELGFSFRETLGLLVAFNLLAALLALPAGRWSDRTGRVRFLATGWAVYGLAYAAMALSPGRLGFATALLAYGAFYGLTEGVEKALLGDLLHPEHRGTGYGALQLALGLAALTASLLMGVLMTAWGSRAAFLATGGLAVMAAILLVIWGVLRKR
ncbi:MAG TPA: MFS transporter [Holophagaceae bacterium]|nr:MFS transporter [Holophagaceae bacterium]HJW34133.1 MFS transporter [Holophagaceae bacterium]